MLNRKGMDPHDKQHILKADLNMTPLVMDRFILT